MGCQVSRPQDVVVIEEIKASQLLDGSFKRPSSHTASEIPQNEPAAMIPQSSAPSDALVDQSWDVDQPKDLKETPTEETIPIEEEGSLAEKESDEEEGPSTEEEPIEEPAEEETPSEEGEAAEEEEEIPLLPLTWTKTACCGTKCEIAASRYCCEHDLTLHVAQYCNACRERYQDWQLANQAFEDMLRELEPTIHASSESEDSHSSNSTEPQDEGNNTSWAYDDASSYGLLQVRQYDKDANDQEKCPIYLDPFTSSAKTLPTNLPYGRSSCRTSTGADTPLADYSYKTAPVEGPDLDTQTGRYEVMHSPSRTLPSCSSKTAPRRTKSPKAWTAQVRRYLYLSSRGASLSSLSLGESETGSMHSLFD